MSAPRLPRRRFLQGGVALGAAAALGACRDDGDPRSAPTTTVAARPTPDGTLVVLTLAGGNDALSTVAPVADPVYQGARGDLALDPATALDVGEGFALHPALVRTKGLWDEDRLAIVHGVGFDGLDRSHFHCMDVWQSADPHEPSTGWLGRWLDLAGGDALDAVAIGRRLPLLATGSRKTAAVLPPGPFELPGAADLPAHLQALAAAGADQPPVRQAAARSTADLLAVVGAVGPALATAPAEDTLADRLETVARLIEADLPTRAYAVEHGGFDTHAGQAATHAALLADLDDAVGAFLERLADRPVTVLIYSEFGRRVAPNGSAGTDHGSAGTVLVAGRVRGGHLGDPPPLDDLTEGDLRTTTDFRAIYAGLLEGVLAVDAQDVLGPDIPRSLTLI